MSINFTVNTLILTKKNCISENPLCFKINKKEFEELTGDI